KIKVLCPAMNVNKAALFIIVLLTCLFVCFVCEAHEDNHELDKNFELLSGYSRLTQIIKEKEAYQQLDLEVENSEFIRLYLMNATYPACLQRKIQAAKLLCRIREAANSERSETLKVLAIHKTESEAEHCSIDTSNERCSTLINYKPRPNMLPKFNKIDEGLEKRK
ncbi:MAG: hypothetical protein MK188_09175, partial [Gammaproteobacteria bacterium]|nr:hypothetical protein [Gammaproteobacteria bacterium]